MLLSKNLKDGWIDEILLVQHFHHLSFVFTFIRTKSCFEFSALNPLAGPDPDSGRAEGATEAPERFSPSLRMIKTDVTPDLWFCLCRQLKHEGANSISWDGCFGPVLAH